MNNQGTRLLQRIFDAVDAHREQFPLQANPNDPPTDTGRNNSPTGTAGTSNTSNTSNTANDEKTRAFKHVMQTKHAHLKDIYNEWYGLGRFENCPIPGGIAACEARWKKKWRNANDNQKVSRIHRIAATFKKDLESALEGSNAASRSRIQKEKEEQWEGWYQCEQVKKGHQNMVDYLQDNVGLLRKQKPRGRKRKAQAAPVDQ